MAGEYSKLPGADEAAPSAQGYVSPYTQTIAGQPAQSQYPPGQYPPMAPLGGYAPPYPPPTGYAPPGTYYATEPPQEAAFGYPVVGQSVVREWKSHFCCLFGDCEATDFGSCIIAWFCPCFAFGQNMARALRMSWRMECLKFLLFMMGLSLVNQLWRMACIIPYRSPSPNTITGSDMSEDLPHLGQASSSTRGLLTLRVGHSEIQCDPNVLSVTSLISLGAAITMAIWASGRRTAIRTRYGIMGSRECDAIMWFCFPTCTLAQETRTLAHNNVVDGVWYGPAVAPPVPGSLPGVASNMGVWQRIAPMPLHAPEWRQ